MQLITKDILKRLPAIGAGAEKTAEDTKVPLKLFNPIGQGTWYITEYDPETETAFGWCDLGFPELGYVSLAELRSVRLPFGMGIERDRFWDPETTLAEVMSGKRS